MLADVYLFDRPAADAKDLNLIAPQGGQVEILGKYHLWYKVRVAPRGQAASVVERWVPARWVALPEPEEGQPEPVIPTLIP